MQSDFINEKESLCTLPSNTIQYNQLPIEENNQTTANQTIDLLQTPKLTNRQNKPPSLCDELPLKKLYRNNKIQLDLLNTYLINNKLNFDVSFIKNNKKSMAKKLSSSSLPLTKTNSTSSLCPLNKSSTTTIETNNKNEKRKKKSKNKCCSMKHHISKKNDHLKTCSNVTKIRQKIDQNVNKYRKKSSSQKKINFDKTYERFMEDEKKRKNEILLLKKKLEEADKKICTHKPKISKCESANEFNFLERMEKYKEEQKNKDKLLKEKILKEEYENININNILLKNKTKNKKINVDETIQNLFDWERQRKLRIEKEKRKLDNIMAKSCRDAPKITKYKSKRNNQNKNIIYRLYDEYFLDKNKNKLKAQASMPSLSAHPKMHENKLRRNASQKEFNISNIFVEEDKKEENDVKTLEIKNNNKNKCIVVIRKIKK